MDIVFKLKLDLRRALRSAHCADLRLNVAHTHVRARACALAFYHIR